VNSQHFPNDNSLQQKHAIALSESQEQESILFLLSEFSEKERMASLSCPLVKEIGLRVSAELDWVGENLGFFLTLASKKGVSSIIDTLLDSISDSEELFVKSR